MRIDQIRGEIKVATGMIGRILDELVSKTGAKAPSAIYLTRREDGTHEASITLEII
jgi:hypothetical protein